MEITKDEMATIIATLRNKDNYREVSKGFFRRVPSLSGYVYELKKMDLLADYRVVIIVNTNPDYTYPKEKTEIDNYTFLVYNVNDFDTYRKRATIVATKLSNVIEDLVDRVREEQEDLPYGYVRDDKGQIQVDSIKADEVRQIYKMYIETRSMKKIAKELKTNFSHVRDVLRDDRYDEMHVEEVVNNFLKRKYESNGHGGLFVIHNCTYDLRRMSIWTQMCHFLDTII